MKKPRPINSALHYLAMAGMLLFGASQTVAQPNSGVAFPPDFDISSLRQGNAPPLNFSMPSSPRQSDPSVTREFNFVRGRYDNYSGGRGRRGGWWDTDYPDAEQNFLRGVQRYTNIDTDPRAYRWIDLSDPELFENIFLYMTMKRVPIGGMRSGPNFNPAEVENLREFMLRGGFVMLDDFWTEAHYQDFLIEMAKIFPEREVIKLDLNHEIFRIFYDVERVPQVPGRAVTWDYGSVTLDDPRYPPSVFAVLDDDGRVMLVANHNSDMGDGWEHTFLEMYPTQMTNEAYRLGINYLIYAYTR